MRVILRLSNQLPRRVVFEIPDEVSIAIPVIVIEFFKYLPEVIEVTNHLLNEFAVHVAALFLSSSPFGKYQSISSKRM